MATCRPAEPYFTILCPAFLQKRCRSVSIFALLVIFASLRKQEAFRHLNDASFYTKLNPNLRETKLKCCST